MPKKSAKKSAKPMGRKQMKKAKGGMGDGSVRFVSINIATSTFSTQPGSTKVDPSISN